MVFFSPVSDGYNRYAGSFKAQVNINPVLPQHRKGRLSQYSRNQLELLKTKFNIKPWVYFRKPDVGVTVEYLNRFLSRKDLVVSALWQHFLKKPVTASPGHICCLMLIPHFERLVNRNTLLSQTSQRHSTKSLSPEALQSTAELSHHLLCNRLNSWRPIFVICGFFAYLWVHYFLDASIANLNGKIRLSAREILILW